MFFYLSLQFTALVAGTIGHQETDNLNPKRRSLHRQKELLLLDLKKITATPIGLSGKNQI